MGREIRRVPPNWEHPKYPADDRRAGQYKPMEDKDFETACAEWKKDFAAWEAQTYTAASNEYMDKFEFWEWAGTPDRELCRPAFTEEPTWFQIYENVSEGTPVSPPFATKAELVDWLVENGDRVHGPVSREQADAFVEDEWAPSMMVVPGRGIIGGIQSSTLGKEADNA